MNEKAFKTYDVRGIYPDEVNEDLAYRVGRAFVSFLEEESPRIVVGHDARESSPGLAEKLKEGIVEGGGTVIDIGMSTTPLLNYTVCKNDYSGGVAVTASHNPPRFNGLKLIKRKGLQVYGNKIKKIKKIIEKEDFTSGKGKIKTVNPVDDYLDHIYSFGADAEKLKIVVDYGNSVASLTGKPLFDRMNIETIHLYDRIDGSFPNHEANPTPENMKALIETVKKEEADLGVFFDGDGDRAVFIDEKGEVVYPDLLTALLAPEELPDSKEKKIYFDLRFSKVVPEVISEAGGIPEMMRVGNPFYKEKLIGEGGLMGVELSGHVMHKDNFCIDDGLFIAVKLIDFLSGKKSFSELVKPLKRYYQSEEINMEVEDKEKVLKEVENAYPDGAHYDLDGVYVEFEDWWFNLRKSNTEDLVRLRLEADDEEILKKRKKELISLIEG